ncbi:DNA-3-methyladenine glycosylase 2 family protein [Methylobacterium sp. Leaf117]|uniref:DNA-3-methyladenine glycosylase family protein n=1 Tax=Methylobacterium sp. Leaf117 TaxID=1736260 RepID=UPI000AA97B48|nr:DNA-3-methyladenine glycosylase 2 family protein [Methylobacterium sp. Leaf117]
MMPEADSHAHLLAVAQRLSMPLYAALAGLGPVAITPPTHARVADRLALEVVNQQLSTKAAAAIWSRVEAASAAQGLAPRDLFVAEHTETLRSCGLSAAKVRAVQAIRLADEAGLFGPSLATLPHPERSAILRSIKGVGQWTADMIGIFHYGDPDIWPAGDVAAVGCLRRLTDGTATQAFDTRAFTAPFAPYRSHLAVSLWRLRDGVPAPTVAV